MLEDILAYLRNWFCVEKIDGEFTIDAGRITFPDGATTPDNQQYIRIFGSIFNDGLHMYLDDTFTDEVFTGTVWLLAVPTPVVKLAGEVEEYCAASFDPSAGAPLTSESFDGYSYKRATNANGNILDWRDVFGARLARWRKL